MTLPSRPRHAFIPQDGELRGLDPHPTDLDPTRTESLLKVTGEHRAGYRDHVLYAMALGTGLREHELCARKAWEGRK